MNDETPTKGKWSLPRVRAPRLRVPRLDVSRLRVPRPQVPEPVEAAWFGLERRVVWPLQDRFALLDARQRRVVIGCGGATLVAVVLVAVLALSSAGGSSSPATTVSAVSTSPQPAAVPPPAPVPQPKPEKEKPRETLHGAAPVFTPPSHAIKGGVKTGKSNPKAVERKAQRAPEPEGEAPAEAASAPAGTATSSSPAAATISSNPKSSEAAKTAEASTADPAPAGRAAVPDGPPAGPAALEVAREFATGFVVYETGGEASAFRDAFKGSATPELTKALLKRPPKQPAGVKVPRAKVLNVVAGPSQGSVYKVSVALLRVGVTSELRLDMERIKTAGKHGKRAEWRVTNVLG
jgi:hypothetical protein